MTTIETELRKYRMCRAELARGCNFRCGECSNNIPGSMMHHFSTIETALGEAA